MANENEIREAAYYIWLNNGCPEGVEIDCWLEAEADECKCEEGVCPCCGKSPCECGPDCECRKAGGPCECEEEKKPAKKAAAKKTVVKAEKEEKKPAAKKTTAKKVAAKK